MAFANGPAMAESCMPFALGIAGGYEGVARA
jgi:hypothetical protein